MPCQLQILKQNTLKNDHFFSTFCGFLELQLPFPEFFFEARKIPNLIHTITDP